MSSVAPLIQTRDLQAWYGSSHVLHGIDLSLHAGETLGLLGRNGMGKSTLIRSMLGLVPQRSGSVHLYAQFKLHVAFGDKKPYLPHQISRLGLAYVPEGRGIFGNLTVLENLQVAARGAEQSRLSARNTQSPEPWTQDRVLRTFPRLAERLAYLGGQLSGGEQQMLSIGRALMTNPQVLILDEATEGLAPLIVQEIWRVIAHLRTTGLATLVVDRNFRHVLAHSDRITVLEKGRVAMQGACAEFSTPEQTAKLASLLGV